MIVYESEHVWHLIMYIIHDSESYVLLIHDNVYIYIWRIPISFSLQWQGLPFFAFVCVRTECVPPENTRGGVPETRNGARDDGGWAWNVH